MNLDNLLKEIEKKSENAQVQEKHSFRIKNEDFEVLSFTPRRRDEFVLDISACASDLKRQINVVIPYIYEAFQLQELAVRAKENGLIDRYYDIVKKLFNTEEILSATAFLYKINNVWGTGVEGSVDEIKKL